MIPNKIWFVHANQNDCDIIRTSQRKIQIPKTNKVQKLIETGSIGFHNILFVLIFIVVVIFAGMLRPETKRFFQSNGEKTFLKITYLPSTVAVLTSGSGSIIFSSDMRSEGTSCIWTLGAHAKCRNWSNTSCLTQLRYWKKIKMS